MNAKDKPLLNSAQQIAHMLEKGIRFEIVSTEEAERYLQENNNYFKLRAYRKNFEKYIGGKNDDKYINLDFAALKDLAIIDMHLRYVVIHMALDTEHFLKVKLLQRAEQQGEDGYKIVSDFFSELKTRDAANGTYYHNQLIDELNRNQNNPYCGGIIQACSDGYSIWAFIEVIPLGSLLSFYRFCGDRFQDKDMLDDYHLMKDIRELRNAAAHNNCILHDMKAKDKRFTPNYKMVSAISSIPKPTRDKRLSNERMRQLCTLLYVHSILVSSSGIRNHTKDALHSLIDRMYRHKDYYGENSVIISSFRFFEKCVDIFFPQQA